MDESTEKLQNLWGIVLDEMDSMELTKLNQLHMNLWKSPEKEINERELGEFMYEIFSKYKPKEFKTLVHDI